MKKWMIGLILFALLSMTVLLSALTSSEDPSLSATKTAIAEANTTTEALIFATQTASGYAYSATATAAPIQATMASSGNDDRNQVQPEQNTQQQKRIVIYTANVHIVADNPDIVIGQIGLLIEDLGGWIVTSNANIQSNKRTSGTISVRVPAAQLDYAVETIKSYGVSVTSETISGSDVTNQYVDMSSRLKNLLASETQLLAIMNDAENVEGVLAVFTELTRIRGDIESIQGQLNYYDESSSFSSLSVSVDPMIPTPEPYVAPEWHPSNAIDDARVDLEHNIQQMTDGLIHFTITTLPIVLIFVIAAGMILRISWWVWKQTQ